MVLLPLVAEIVTGLCICCFILLAFQSSYIILTSVSFSIILTPSQLLDKDGLTVVHDHCFCFLLATPVYYT